MDRRAFLGVLGLLGAPLGATHVNRTRFRLYGMASASWDT